MVIADGGAGAGGAGAGGAGAATAGRARLDDAPCVVLCNAPPAEAQSLARALVERRLAACVNVIPGVVSVYRWQGAIEQDDESTLLIKTRRSRVPELTEAVRSLHSYSVPEVLVVPADPALGNPDYLAWLVLETTDEGARPSDA